MLSWCCVAMPGPRRQPDLPLLRPWYAPRKAVGETTQFDDTPLFIPIETPNKGRQGCSIMTELSPPANLEALFSNHAVHAPRACSAMAVFFKTNVYGRAAIRSGQPRGGVDDLRVLQGRPREDGQGPRRWCASLHAPQTHTHTHPFAIRLLAVGAPLHPHSPCPVSTSQLTPTPTHSHTQTPSRRPPPCRRCTPSPPLLVTARAHRQIYKHSGQSVKLPQLPTKHPPTVTPNATLCTGLVYHQICGAPASGPTVWRRGQSPTPTLVWAKLVPSAHPLLLPSSSPLIDPLQSPGFKPRVHSSAPLLSSSAPLFLCCSAPMPLRPSAFCSSHPLLLPRCGPRGCSSIHYKTPAPSCAYTRLPSPL